MNQNAENSDEPSHQQDNRDEEFEVEVHIRQIEQQDEEAVKSLIYDGICISTMNRLVLNNMERPYVLCGIGFCAILVNWLTGGLILALVISVVCLPFAIYIILRYCILVRYKYKNLKDVTNGVYKYWSESESGRKMWVAECTGRIVGCVAIETLSPMVVELKRLCVDTEWQCMGVGGRMTDFAMEHIKQRQFKEVMTESYSVNPEAANLFNKIGFKNVGSKKAFCGICTFDSFSYKIPSRSRSDLNLNDN